MVAASGPLHVVKQGWLGRELASLGNCQSDTVLVTAPRAANAGGRAGRNPDEVLHFFSGSPWFCGECAPGSGCRRPVRGRWSAGLLPRPAEGLARPGFPTQPPAAETPKSRPGSPIIEVESGIMRHMWLGRFQNRLYSLGADLHTRPAVPYRMYVCIATWCPILRAYAAGSRFLLRGVPGLSGSQVLPGLPGEVKLPLQARMHTGHTGGPGGRRKKSSWELTRSEPRRIHLSEY